MAKRRTAEHYISKAGKPVFLFHGSEFGGCPHGHFMCLEGAEPAPPEQFMRDIWRKGHAGETLTKAQMQGEGFTIHYASSNVDEQLKVELKLGMGEKGFLILSCSLDGLCEIEDPEAFAAAMQWIQQGDASRPWGGEISDLEVKRLGREPLEDFRRYGLHTPGHFETYRWQTSAGVHAVRKEPGCEKAGLLVIAQRRWSDKEEATMSPEQLATQELVGWYYAEPAYTEKECLDVCTAHVDAWLSRRCPPCKSEYPCRWPFPEVANASLEALAREALEAYDTVNYWKQLYEARSCALIAAMSEAQHASFEMQGVTYGTAAKGAKLTIKRGG